MKTKRFFSIILVVTLLCSSFAFSFSAGAEEVASTPSFITDSTTGLFVHGTSQEDTEAWQQAQSEEDEDGNIVNASKKYFFLPSGADSTTVQLYNAYDYAVTVNGVTIGANSSASVSYKTDTAYKVTDSSGNKLYTVYFKLSTAEAAIYINNPDADGSGTELYDYLTVNNDDKSKNAKGTGAIVDSDGSVDNTTIKKIKGRGNTTWSKAKKPFNVTYDSNVKIGGMDKCKKFSLLANYQDATLSRNRILYDLADAVGLPYASDSRYVDFYIDGVYYGSYLCAQKIEVGSNDVVNDIDDTAYLNEDGSLADDFPFLMEIDPSYSSDDYHTTGNGSTDITIKAPEIASGETGYDEVKEYVAGKFNKLYSAISNSASEETLSELMDIESFAKLYLINELGKNWDSGVSSVYMVYKQDDDGNWKFFASPVWDYDNSIGNATGVSGDLSYMGVDNYTEYSGWWCKYKGKRASAKTSTNIMNRCANCTVILNEAAQVWFDDFVPALNIYNSHGVSEGEIYSKDVYYNLCKGSADMNYTRGWLINTGDWISDHSSLYKAQYNYSTDTYTVLTNKTTYDETFKGEFDYMSDWLDSRAAWLSAQFRSSYTEKECEQDDVDGSGVVDINDVTAIQKIVIGFNYTDNQRKVADINGDGVVNVSDATALQKKLANA